MNNPIMAKPLSKIGRFGRSFLKRYMYSQLSIWNGFLIAIGKEQPFIKFKIEKDPPSIYWVYRIKSSEIEGLAQKLGIPSQFSLCPIQCLDTDEPDYLLAVNVYRVSGIASGIRAEWSVFVHDASNTPRYMIVEAWSSKFSMDPIHIFTKASTVLHERIGNEIHTQIGEKDNGFTSKITVPEIEDPATLSEEWVAANDYIYWKNGICDRTFYNAGLAHAKQLCISNENSIITDGTFWGQIVEPDPLHILIVENEIEFVISPWENVDRVNV